MKTLTVVMILLAGSAALADGRPGMGEVARLRARANFYARAGKARPAELARQAADAMARAADPVTIYVPVIRSERMTRAEALGFTEAVIKAIEKETRFKVVASPEDADLILDASPQPAVRPKP